MTEQFDVAQDVLDQLKAAAASLGFDAIQRGQTHLEVILSAYGEPYALVMLSDVRGFFQADADLSKNKERFDDFQDECLAELGDSKLPKTMLLVIPDELREHRDMMRLQVALESDGYYTRKMVCTQDDLASQLGSPFEAWPQLAQAHGSYHVLTDREYEWDKHPPSTATVLFNRFGLEALCEEVAAHPRAEHIRAKAARMLRRILGSIYTMVWDEEQYFLGKFGEEGGLPLAYSSSGEKLVANLCLFLALQYERQDPKLVLGMTDAVSSLDNLRGYAAAECLRDFVLATGAGVYYRGDKEQPRQLIERTMARCKQILDKVKTAV